MNPYPNVLTATDNLLLEDAGNGRFDAIIRGRQEITDQFLAECEELRTIDGQRFRRNQDAVLAAQVPEAVFNEWVRNGFNPLADENITINMVIARLKAEGRDKFVTTSKTF